MKTLLKNGLVYDGSVSLPQKKDILIENKKIIKIADKIDVEADKVIDCKGLNVAPGFIDAHSHNDFFVGREDSVNFFESFINQGITTQIVGNCGFSVAGVDENTKYHGLIGGGLFKTKKAGSLKDWVKENKNNLEVNIIPLIGHGSARISVSGYKNSPLTNDEEKEMLSLLERDLKDGAWGGSFGLMYEPGMYAKVNELKKFAEVIKKYDGILTVHPRACSDVSNGFPLLKRHHLELGLDEVIDVIKSTNVRCEYSHLIFTGEKSWARLPFMLKKFKDLKDEGYEIGYDMYSYTYGASVITVILPPDFMATPKEKRMHGFKYLKTRLLINITKKLLGIDFTDLTVAYIGKGYEKYEGRKISDIAKDEGISPMKMYFKLVELSDGKGNLYLDKYYNKDMILKLMEDDMSVFMTDAWHEEKGLQNASAYTCYPNFFKLALGAGIPYQNIINKMTGKIADRFKLENRGYIKEGFYADITIFSEFDFKNPVDKPTGLEYLFINGEIAYENNSYNKKKLGEFILKNEH